MSPRAADLDPQTQRNLAYAAIGSLDQDERRELLFYLGQHHPAMLLTSIEGLRDEGTLPDGWDQAD